MPDIFSDLREWGTILAQIERLRRDGSLDDHQKGLIRILRYPYNWRLRHAVLEAVAELRNPTEDLLKAICAIAANEECELGTRLLACDAMEISLRRARNLGKPGILEPVAIAEAQSILSASQPPILRQAVERWLQFARVPEDSLLAVGADQWRQIPETQSFGGT